MRAKTTIISVLFVALVRKNASLASQLWLSSFSKLNFEFISWWEIFLSLPFFFLPEPKNEISLAIPDTVCEIQLHPVGSLQGYEFF